MRLNNKVRSLRKQRCFSQQEVADSLGILRTTLSKIENGHLVPGTKLMMRFEKIFEKPFGDIFFTSSVSYDETIKKGKLFNTMPGIFYYIL